MTFAGIGRHIISAPQSAEQPACLSWVMSYWFIIGTGKMFREGDNTMDGDARIGVHRCMWTDGLICDLGSSNILLVLYVYI